LRELPAPKDASKRVWLGVFMMAVMSFVDGVDDCGWSGVDGVDGIDDGRCNCLDKHGGRCQGHCFGKETPLNRPDVTRVTLIFPEADRVRTRFP
jgi:hypothetical protein